MSAIENKMYGNKVNILLCLSAMHKSHNYEGSNNPSLNATKHEEFPRVFTDQKCRTHGWWNHQVAKSNLKNYKTSNIR